MNFNLSTEFTLTLLEKSKRKSFFFPERMAIEPTNKLSKLTDKLDIYIFGQCESHSVRTHLDGH